MQIEQLRRLFFVANRYDIHQIGICWKDAQQGVAPDAGELISAFRTTMIAGNYLNFSLTAFKLNPTTLFSR